jgi:Phosphate ATP-binding cassette transporter.
MTPSLIVAILLFLSLAGYWLGRRAVLGMASGDFRRLHSLPRYYGYYVALLTLLPALLLLVLWLSLDETVITRLVMVDLPPP